VRALQRCVGPGDVCFAELGALPPCALHAMCLDHGSCTPRALHTQRQERRRGGRWGRWGNGTHTRGLVVNLAEELLDAAPSAVRVPCSRAPHPKSTRAHTLTGRKA
jgi:hypothetical protein